MQEISVDAVIAWIGAHPMAAGAAVFVVAFLDALVAIGLLMPSGPILIAVGALIGLGALDAPYIIGCAALGALLGDGASFLFGHHYGQRMRGMWPFSRYPHWLQRGESLFRRHGAKGIVIARYVGAVRPFVPAIAGMLRMPLRRFVPASLFAAVSWALLFIGPGWLLGASLELLVAVAGRLAIVLGILFALLAAIYWLVGGLYRRLSPHANSALERVLAWSRRHPWLGRYSAALIDPNRPESPSLVLLALLLTAAAVALLWLLVAVAGGGEPLSLDMAVHRAFFELRSPLADHLLAMFAVLGDTEVLAPATLLVFGWLLWRRRRIAAWHWLLAPGFGLLLVQVLGSSLDVPRPPTALAVPDFSFPSGPVMLSTAVYGFFAVLIARELPGRRRAWPYVLAGLLVGLVGFARLYLGAHWFSDVLAGLALGLCWIAVLGIAYRRRVVRSFWVRPIATVFFAAVAAAGIWHALRDSAALLERYRPLVHHTAVSRTDWWQSDWSRLPARRNDALDPAAWPINLQYAGSLSALAQRLEADGWSRPPTAGWATLLRSLDSEATAQTLPLLAASHQGQADVLLLSRAGDTPEQRHVVHLWPSALRTMPGGVPLWQGAVTTVRFERRWGIAWWTTIEVSTAALDRLAAATVGLPTRRLQRPGAADLLLVGER